MLNNENPVIGVVIDAPLFDYQNQIYRAIEHAARYVGCRLVFFISDTMGSDVRVTRNTLQQLPLLVDRGLVEGLIVSAGSVLPEPTMREAFFTQWQGMPIVSIAVAEAGHGAVLLDNAAGMRELVEHLVDVHGARHLAFLGGPSENPDAAQRYAAFLEVIAAKGLEHNEQWYYEGPFIKETGEIGVLTILGHRGLVPDSIVAANDLIAFGAIDALKSMGKLVPKEVRVTGFDDSTDCAFSFPALTSVSQPYAQIGLEAVQLVMEQLAGLPPRTVKVGSKVHVRNSCSCMIMDEFSAGDGVLGTLTASPGGAGAEKPGAAMGALAKTEPGVTKGAALARGPSAAEGASAKGEPSASDSAPGELSAMPGSESGHYWALQVTEMIAQLTELVEKNLDDGIFDSDGFLLHWDHLVELLASNNQPLAIAEHLLKNLLQGCINSRRASLDAGADPGAEQALIGVYRITGQCRRAGQAWLSHKSRQYSRLAEKKADAEHQHIRDLRDSIYMIQSLAELVRGVKDFFYKFAIQGYVLAILEGESAKVILGQNGKDNLDGQKVDSRQLLGLLARYGESRQNLVVETIYLFERTACLMYELHERSADFIIQVKAIITGALQKFVLFDRLKEQTARLNEQKQMLLERRQYFKELTAAVIKALAMTVEAKDPYTAGHEQRVAKLARAIAGNMNLGDDQIEAVSLAAIVHDLGKLFLPLEILNKPGRLNPIELGLIRRHPEIAWDILKTIDFPWPLAEMVWQHHEHWDGQGYPLGLKADQISLGARIITVADVVEAMASHRPYRPALGIEKALGEIRNKKGTMFDPVVADACLDLFENRGFSLE